MRNIFNYVERSSPIHDLTGATKLVCLLLWSFAAMTTYDTRMLAVLPLFSFVLFALSRIRLRDVSFMLGFTAVFMVLNNLLVFLFAPEHGVSLYGTRHVLFTLGGRWVVTREQLFYHLNLLLKYLSTIPIVLLFVCTTQPSEFAASLNRIGVKYTVAYSVALALRYIPDIQQEYHEISQSQEARGVALGKDVKFFERIKNSAKILLPLVLTSLNRIDDISNSMQLRSFGKNRKRTWYTKKKMTAADYGVIAFCIILFVVGMIITNQGGNNLFNPFVR